MTVLAVVVVVVVGVGMVGVMVIVVVVVVVAVVCVVIIVVVVVLSGPIVFIVSSKLCNQAVHCLLQSLYLLFKLNSVVPASKLKLIKFKPGDFWDTV